MIPIPPDLDIWSDHAVIEGTGVLKFVVNMYHVPYVPYFPFLRPDQKAMRTGNDCLLAAWRTVRVVRVG